MFQDVKKVKLNFKFTYLSEPQSNRVHIEFRRLAMFTGTYSAVRFLPGSIILLTFCPKP